MKLLTLAMGLLLAGTMAAQPAPKAPQAKQTQSSKQPAQFQPQAKQAAGAGPDKVWVNSKSNVYHCPSDRYYGRTKDGKYMTEKDAKAAGAHGVKGQTCFK